MKFKVFTFSFLMGIALQINAGTTIGDDFFDKANSFFSNNVTDGLIKYDQLKNNVKLDDLIRQIAEADLSGKNKNEIQTFYINSYNLLVINAIAERYPLKSVMDVNGFFDSKKRRIAGENLTLNQIEKQKLLKVYNDARFHFVLVCGAKGCPPITNFAYSPDKLEMQLQQQTRKALNDPTFIKVNNANKSVELSQIFDWYSSDFGGKKNVINYINKFRSDKIGNDFKSNFYKYDWSVNKVSDGMGSAKSKDHNGGTTPIVSSNSAARYVTSAAIPKGTTETKLFNNLYTQRTGSKEALTSRSNFFTSSLSFLYGFTNRFNAGFDLRYRRVSNANLPSSPFGVLTNREAVSRRDGFTQVGPKIRWAPTAALPNFSVQSSFTFPLGSNLEGTNDQPYIDWDGATWFTQLFNDFTLNDNFSVFTEVDVVLEDIGQGDLNRFSTPGTVIFSYFPNPKTTFYTLASYSPFWQENYDYFAQAGVGAKYQITPDFEVELLYTGFTNQFLIETGGDAATFNIGVRYSK